MLHGQVQQGHDEEDPGVGGEEPVDPVGDRENPAQHVRPGHFAGGDDHIDQAAADPVEDHLQPEAEVAGDFEDTPGLTGLLGRRSVAHISADETEDVEGPVGPDLHQPADCVLEGAGSGVVQHPSCAKGMQNQHIEHG